MHVNASKFPFQINEAYFSEETYFDKLSEDGEVAPARPRGVPLLEWEAFKE